MKNFQGGTYKLAGGGGGGGSPPMVVFPPTPLVGKNMRTGKGKWEKNKGNVRKEKGRKTGKIQYSQRDENKGKRERVEQMLTFVGGGKIFIRKRGRGQSSSPRKI